MHVVRLEADASVDYALTPGRHAYLQVTDGTLRVNGAELAAGDGAAIVNEDRIQVSAMGDGPARALLFDVAEGA